MGTFHKDRGELHGMTVVVDTPGPMVYVGRCDTVDDTEVVLHDADEHEDGRGGRSKRDYLERAKKLGIWSRHARLRIAMTDVSSIQLLAQLASEAPRAAAGQRPASGAPSPRAETQRAAAPEAPGAGKEASADLVSLTPAARAEVKRLLAQADHAGKGLRLRVAGGGCSGLVYKLDFDEERPGDLVVAGEGFWIYVDRKSAIYLRDVILDHQSGLEGRGFVFKNPNAANTCGCGESFSL